MTPLPHDLWLDRGPGGPHDENRDPPVEPDEEDWNDELDRMPDYLDYPLEGQP